MSEESLKGARSSLSYLLPLGIFGALAVFFMIALYSGDPSRLPSALIGKPVPQFTLPPVEGLTRDGKPVPGFASADLVTGEPAVIVVWASWCTPCVQEQPTLMAFKAQHKVRLVGLNYKDEPAAARRFLQKLGNPFDAVGADRNGRVAIDWGVYGAPETYVVDGRGQITYKYVGPLTRTVLQSELLPAIAKARAAKASG
jgi:cytochrome c biogenesis protein CcmG/thiol:disulfide interchange protein DsbE